MTENYLSHSGKTNMAVDHGAERWDLTGDFTGHGNRVIKSRLFEFLFGREEHKPWILDLYNAVNGSAHDNPDDITINTIENVVYLGMKNDLSLMVSETVSFYRGMEVYEQQSTFNPNMPVREFMYAGKLYDKFLYLSGANRYGRQLISLPIPKLVVFYNGEEEQEDQVILELSDSFKEEIRHVLKNTGKTLTKEEEEAEIDRLFRKADPDIAVKVRMININYGHSRKILDACKPLAEYSWFIHRIRTMMKSDGKIGSVGLEAAIDRAIDEMPESFVTREVILGNRAEVKDMCLTEYNETEAMGLFRKEGREEGWEKGREEGLEEGFKKGSLQVLLALVHDGLLTPAQGAERAKMDEESFLREMENNDQGVSSGRV